MPDNPKSPSVEILAHISAPATTAADTNYRQLAQTYLDFIPGSRVDIVGASRGAEPLNAIVIASSNEGTSQELGSSEEQRSVSIAEFCSPNRTKEFWEQQTRLKGKEAAAVETRHVEESQASAELGSRPRGTDSMSVAAKARTVHSGLIEIPATQESIETDVDIIPSSQPPPVPPLSSLLGSSRRSIPPPFSPSPKRLCLSPEPSQLQRAESAPLLISQRSLPIQKTNSDLGPHLAPHPPILRQELQKRLLDRHPSPLSIQQRRFQERFYDALEIYAPDTQDNSTCAFDPKDLMTPKLRQVAQDLNVERRFKFQKERELRDTERGYWVMDTRGWPGELREGCWRFLANWVGAGFAGWGVRCYRAANGEWIRAYCWGITVGAVYGMVYLASERRLKGERTEWIDGDGKAVVVVEARGSVSTIV